MDTTAKPMPSEERAPSGSRAIYLSLACMLLGAPLASALEGKPPVLAGQPRAIDAMADSTEATSRPRAGGDRNVLFIVIDDLRTELGCYGARSVRSPNIDRLAREGVLFERAYCQYSLCNPSRTSLLTGLRPDRSGVVGNHVHFRDRHPNLVTLPQHFKQHGYEARALGKIWHGVFPKGSSRQPADTMGDPPSWSRSPYRPGPRYYYTEAGIEQAKRAYKRMYRVESPTPDEWTTRLVFGPMTEAPEVDDDVLYDGDVAARAIETLRELRDAPFFLAVGFIKPHTPFVAPKRYWDLYDAREIELATRTTLPEGAPAFSGHRSGEVRRYTDQPARGAFSTENQRRLRHGYFACVSYIDTQVGKILDELHRLELHEKTIVVLFGDHGWHLGEHGLWGKGTDLELDTRVPLIVSAPGLAVNAKTAAMTELLDLYPTLSELAGLPLPGHLDGKSFASVLHDPTSEVKTAAFSQVTRGKRMGYSVRVAGARLTEWVDRRTGALETRELYRYEDGPRHRVETANLAERPEYAAEIARLSQRLQAIRPVPEEHRLRLDPIYQDHMVLQRDVRLPIRGRGRPGASVSVRFGDAMREAKVGDKGHWVVHLPARSASARPNSLTISSGVEEIEIHDVLVGEVWLCAGQSNMEWPLARAQNSAEALEGASRRPIRLMSIEGAARGGSGVYDSATIRRLTQADFSRGEWQVSTPGSARSFSAIGWFFGSRLERELEVPVGMINVSIGGTPIEAWIRRGALAADPNLRPIVEGNWLENGLIEPWCRKRARYNLGRALEEGEPIPGGDSGPNHSFKPGFLWSASVNPLVGLPLRGVLWYQGESNAESLEQVARYGSLFETLARDWGAQWQRDDLPFLCVQLPGMERAAWPEFREEQRRLLARVPGTRLAVTIDLGERRNVHPTRKRPVGERLARLALVDIYRHIEGDASGPMLHSASLRGNTVVLQFDAARSGLRTCDGKPPPWFELAGSDGVFRAGTARIAGRSVVVTADAAEPPVEVRYAWTPYPDPPVSLVNGEGLPAMPFSVRIEEAKKP